MATHDRKLSSLIN